MDLDAYEEKWPKKIIDPEPGIWPFPRPPTDSTFVILLIKIVNGISLEST